MNKKPGVFWHMILGGFVSGAIFGVIFSILPIMLLLVFVFAIFPEASNNDIFSTISAFLILGFIFGGIPGAFLGLVESFFIKRALRAIPEPFTKETMKGKQWLVFPIPIVFSIILSIVYGLITASFSGVVYYWLIAGIPTPIASFASVYVAHRYLHRLQHWSESQYGRKSKAKNEEYYRLMDKAKHDADEFISESETLVGRSER